MTLLACQCLIQHHHSLLQEKPLHLVDKKGESMAGDTPNAFSSDEGIPVELDSSSWPIVHGNRGSMDQTEMHQPIFKQELSLYNSNDNMVDDDSIDAMYLGQMLVRVVPAIVVTTTPYGVLSICCLQFQSAFFADVINGVDSGR